ncbi:MULTISPECIES: spinster family MFS transporter [Mycolicibacterium]|uniref:Arabinose efflux permease family protein n=2 Tax=Mycolicibacterium gilvum TaxID=1804 RepID=E6TN47_MYCSR|nr:MULTISPECIES: MFS transporter [Mycolicibacterium]ABP45914.1 major facilitator superfamily MFS_1 [Mycolicibacterium gilvum PYR-GCK]ADT99405.1 arabinose efflux permease family protein [Mycolicibacterium gilvum Spyr1]MBV5246201.1 MFS transporter [Mycolicibacterium sp. PAM1]
MSAPAAAETTSDTHGPTRAWSAVCVLAVVGTLNYADRFLPAVLAEPIREDLSLSDTAIGVINGFGFLAVYALIGIPIARISDRGAYGLVISGCLSLWGVMTMLGGAVQSGFQLAMTRVGVAIGEAGSTPAAHAYVARNFAPERRAAPLAVITLAIPLASAASLIGGGLLAQALGWRTAFVVMGAISVLFVPVVLAVVGRRQKPLVESVAVQQVPVKWWDILRKPSYLAIVAGAASISVAGYALTTFAPAFLMRARGMTLGDVGLQYGIASGVTGILGLLVVGKVADRLSARDPRWLLWLVALMTAALIPFSTLGLLVASPGLAVLFISLSYVVGTAYMAPSIAAIQRLVPAEQRATASAIFLFFSAILGSAGPFVAGLISDAMKAELGSGSLGRALLCVVPVMHLVAIGCYLLASRRYLRELVN